MRYRVFSLVVDGDFHIRVRFQNIGDIAIVLKFEYYNYLLADQSLMNSVQSIFLFFFFVTDMSEHEK